MEKAWIDATKANSWAGASLFLRSDNCCGALVSKQELAAFLTLTPSYCSLVFESLQT